MWQYNYSSVSSELGHHGVLGMKWGHRKNYRSTGIRAAIARKQNEKVDEGFKKWKENDKLRDDAISSGKKANDELSNEELSKLNKRTQLEQTYKQLNPGKIKKAIKCAAIASAALGTFAKLYTNGKNAIGIGKEIKNTTMQSFGKMSINSLEKYVL